MGYGMQTIKGQNGLRPWEEFKSNQESRSRVERSHKGKQMYEFKCSLCEYEFKQRVGTANVGRRDKVTDAVICPSCKNYLPSHSGEEVKKYKVFAV